MLKKALLFSVLLSSLNFALGQGSQLPKYTVATLPAASTQPHYIVQVIDGASSTDCATGGGAQNVACVNVAGVWQALGSVSPTFTGALTGTSASFSGIVSAGIVNGTVNGSNYSAAPVSPPSLPAGIQSFTAGQEGSPGGTVSAGTYACQVTYIGASGGETTASATSGTVSAAANSALYCAANDAPAGAISYNVYWQTGGIGSYYLGHAGIAFGVQDAQMTTPATSGTTPPGSNTATGVLAGGFAAMGGAPGAMIVPGSTPLSAGNPGDPDNGQMIFDYRQGAISMRSSGCPAQKGATGSAQNNCFNQELNIGNLSANGQQVNAHSITVNNGTPVYGFGLPPIGASVGLFLRQYRFGTNTNTVWTENPLVWIGNQNANAYLSESVVYNSSGADATSDTGGTAYNILSAGSHRAFNGISIQGNWTNGVSCGNNNFSHSCLQIGFGNSYGIYNQSPHYQAAYQTATSSSNYAAPGIFFQSNIWNGTTSGQDIFQIIPTYGTGTNPYRVLNFGLASGFGSGSTNYQFNGGTVLAPSFNAQTSGYQVGGIPVILGTSLGSHGPAAGYILSGISGSVALVSGTATVSTTAACTVGTNCNYSLTRCAANSSTGIGSLSVGTITAGTSFVINSLSTVGAVLTTDASTVCWQIN